MNAIKQKNTTEDQLDRSDQALAELRERLNGDDQETPGVFALARAHEQNPVQHRAMVRARNVLAGRIAELSAFLNQHDEIDLLQASVQVRQTHLELLNAVDTAFANHRTAMLAVFDLEG